MKKALCLLVVLCTMVFRPCSAFGSTKINSEDISLIVTTLDKSYSGAGVTGNITYDYKQNSIIVEMAVDGLATEIVYICNDGMPPSSNEAWATFKDAMISLCNAYTSLLKIIDLHIVFRIVNDDAYIRKDYSTIAYNPLLVIEDGVVVADIVEDMKSN